MLRTKLTYCIVPLVLLTALPASVSAQGPEQQNVSIAAIPAKPIVDQSVPAGWRRYQFGDKPDFSVILPSNPEATAQRGAAGDVTYLYTATNASAIYIGARFGGIVDTAGAERQKTFFEAFIKGFAEGLQQSLASKNVDFKLQYTEPKQITASGHVGFQQDMTLGPFTGRAQVVFIGQWGFAIVSMWTQKTPSSETAAFFDSFKLTP